MKVLFLLLLLAPPPPALPQATNHSSSDIKAASTDKGLGNDEPPSLSGLLNGLLDSFLVAGDEEDGPSPPLSHQQESSVGNNGTSGGGSSPEEDDENDDSTSGESSGEENKKRTEGSSSGEKVSSGGTSKEAKSAICPGACVSPRLTENCEAILRTEGICSKDLECCVSKEKNKDHPDLVVVAPKRQCMGECRSALIGLFLCDEVDGDAFCPESHQSCCMFHPKPPPPQQQGPPRVHQQQEEDSGERRPPPPASSQPPRNVESQNPSQQQQSPSRIPQRQQEQQPPPPPVQQQPPPMYIPRPCPAYCLPRQLFEYCHRPLRNFHCGINGFCCEHDLRPVTTTTTEPPMSEEEEEMELEPQTPAKDKQAANRPCPGSCISEMLAFTCFLNAEMTDAYACPSSPGSKMKCCAPKTTLNSTTTTQKPLLQSIMQSPHPPPIYPHPGGMIMPTSPPLIPPPMYRPPSSPTSLPPHTSLTPGQDKVIVNRPPISRYVCGTKGPPTGRRKRVVGGRDSSPGEWCWQVALINSLNQYLCGGALIGTEWVLTAAHCVTNIVRSGDAIYVRVGDHDLTSKYGSPGAQTLRVATTYIHHNHNSQTLDNDIALLKLQGNVALKQGVCLVCLPSRSGKEIPGKRCVVTGYGYMGESGPIPLRVREAELPIVGEHECIDKVNAVTEKRFVLPASSFCAGGEFKNDACQGDGGGPLVCKEQDGYYELTGLVSWGFGCGRQDVPGVYVKVSSFIGWINQIISVNAGSVA